MTAPPREQGGFLGQPPLRLGTGFPAARPTGPVRAGRFREREQIRALTAVSNESPPGSVRLCRLRRSGGGDASNIVARACGRVLDSFILFIIGGRRFLRRLNATVPSPRVHEPIRPGALVRDGDGYYALVLKAYTNGALWTVPVERTPDPREAAHGHGPGPADGRPRTPASLVRRDHRPEIHAVTVRSSPVRQRAARGAHELAGRITTAAAAALPVYEKRPGSTIFRALKVSRRVPSPVYRAAAGGAKEEPGNKPGSLRLLNFYPHPAYRAAWAQRRGPGKRRPTGQSRWSCKHHSTARDEDERGELGGQGQSSQMPRNRSAFVCPRSISSCVGPPSGRFVSWFHG